MDSPQFQNRNFNSIQQLIDRNLSPEQLERTCSTCDIKGPSTKYSKILDIELPDHLIVQLVRFKSENDISKKIMTPVDCKAVLNLNNNVYAITAILVHEGTEVNSGHYLRM